MILPPLHLLSLTVTIPSNLLTPDPGLTSFLKPGFNPQTSGVVGTTQNVLTLLVEYRCWYSIFSRDNTHAHCAHVLPWQPVAAAMYWSDAPASHGSTCACAAIGRRVSHDAAANELGRALGVN